MFLRRPKSPNPRERGYVLLVIMLAATLLIISLAMAVPEVAHNLKRDREEEMIHRGAQYARAIRRYYGKTHTYPATLDQLLLTNNVRYLRQKYKDPMTGKDFKLLKYGDPNLQMQGTGGISPSGPSGNSGGKNSDQGAATNNLMTTPGPDQGGGKFAGQAVGGGAAPATNPTGVSSANSGSDQTGNNNPPQTTVRTQSPSGETPTGGQATGSDTSGQPQPLASTGPAPTFGGGAIVGVTSTSGEDSIRVFNKKHHYNEWQFVYDPTQEMLSAGGQIVLIKGPYNGPPTNQGPGTPIGNTPGTNSSTTGASPFQQQPSSFGQTPAQNPSTGFGQPPAPPQQ